jgi:hypothetical protein
MATPDFPVFSCGGANEPACPPQPATATQTLNLTVPMYSYLDMIAYGRKCYDKGVVDGLAPAPEAPSA